MKEQDLLTKKYKVKKEDTKEAEKKKKPETRREKIVTRREHHSFKAKNVLDMSDKPDFIGTLGRNALTRISIHNKVTLSQDARESFNEMKRKIYRDNHTDRPHNRR